MKKIYNLIKPRLLSFKTKTDSRKGFIILFSIIGFLFWSGIYAVSLKVLNYFKSINEIGDIIAFKLLSMILITFLTLLIFSSLITFLSKHYLSNDLLLAHSLPVSCKTIFFSRWLESTVDSSWMVVVFTIPILIAYGFVYEAHLFYYFSILIVLLPICFISSAFSSIIIMPLVMILPARRIKSIFVFLGIFCFIIFYLAIRLSRPERMVNPESFASVLLYIKNLSTPSSPFLPSTWAFDSFKSLINNDFSNALFHILTAWTGAVFFIMLSVQLSGFLYFKGYSKAQSFFGKPMRFLNIKIKFLPKTFNAIIIKEIKTFFRDQTQWTQILLLGALIVIYLYNFSVIPLDKSPIKTIYLQNLFSFLNMALAAFVLTAIVARFVFPSISNEGQSFWIIQSGPISIKAFLWIKFCIYLIPMFILSQILIIVSNILLDVSSFMMYLSIISFCFIVPGIVSISIGLGAAYPDFTSENPAQSVTSFGGLLFMIISATYIGTVIILEAGPVYSIIMSSIHKKSLNLNQWIWIIFSFLLAISISLFAIIYPVKFGEKKILDN